VRIVKVDRRTVPVTTPCVNLKGMIMQDGSPKKSEFAVILGELRREKGFSQRRVAAELGISQAVLSHYENDAREPKLDFVIKVCDYYAVTTDYILGRTKERGDGASRLSAKVNEIVDTLEGLKSEEEKLLLELRKLK
jgi:transcriptional regulator with XRE-family HTH domain